MNVKHEFLQYLRFKRQYLACDEVTSYGCIADVLAVDRYKKEVREYEFKRSVSDLYAEKQKQKYQEYSQYILKNDKHYYVKGFKVKIPHRFYFVVSDQLYKLKRDYLEKQNCGIIKYIIYKDEIYFITMKNCRKRVKNLQNYNVVMKDILCRCTSAYLTLLKKQEAGE